MRFHSEVFKNMEKLCITEILYMFVNIRVHTSAIIDPLWASICPMFRKYSLVERSGMLWVICIGSQLLIPSVQSIN
jgi:hypothetical protein